VTQITIRGMEPEIEREIRRLAKKSGKSLNRVILDMIHLHSGLRLKNDRSSTESLGKLAGGWSEKEAAEFMKSIKSCEQIDEELWM